MSIKLDIAKPEMLKPKIAIFGVGGAGGNALKRIRQASFNPDEENGLGPLGFEIFFSFGLFQHVCMRQR